MREFRYDDGESQGDKEVWVDPLEIDEGPAIVRYRELRDERLHRTEVGTKARLIANYHRVAQDLPELPPSEALRYDVSLIEVENGEKLLCIEHTWDSGVYHTAIASTTKSELTRREIDGRMQEFYFDEWWIGTVRDYTAQGSLVRTHETFATNGTVVDEVYFYDAEIHEVVRLIEARLYFEHPEPQPFDQGDIKGTRLV